MASRIAFFQKRCGAVWEPDLLFIVVVRLWFYCPFYCRGRPFY